MTRHGTRGGGIPQGNRVRTEPGLFLFAAVLGKPGPGNATGQEMELVCSG